MVLTRRGEKKGSFGEGENGGSFPIYLYLPLSLYLSFSLHFSCLVFVAIEEATLMMIVLNETLTETHAGSTTPHRTLNDTFSIASFNITCIYIHTCTYTDIYVHLYAYLFLVNVCTSMVTCMSRKFVSNLS